ncbi:hypothetical protein TBLA_0D00220 [Henningerozyma blattae CBS 6284]|uniref:Serine/threonine-protein kinase CBK1 n=1 Tax=Henningerozyma blattae (strain ATCC 34711 / CBS 6284 / DSM 70876 / NBRC 10599 / NRRL Y-10934 / UCD 77-7) TaxID=1071380 RepID=I2H2D0_HENB6|nr:hypothetical protein TBLA_0D00220 [Tetrapisispora blattae CBS 6284]CCH60532.1 hypothetical protein TBLA_0D00220 [Tetrapisispora blattae CBS 6284]
MNNNNFNNTNPHLNSNFSQYEPLQQPSAITDLDGGPYLRGRDSQLSLQDQYSTNNNNSSNNSNSSNINSNGLLPSGFTDVPSLNFPTTPNSISNQQQQHPNNNLQQQQFETNGMSYNNNNNGNINPMSSQSNGYSSEFQQPQSLLYTHTNNSQNLLNQQLQGQQQQAAYSSPTQYSISSDYNNNQNSNTNPNSILNTDTISRSNSPYNQITNNTASSPARSNTPLQYSTQPNPNSNSNMTSVSTPNAPGNSNGAQPTSNPHNSNYMYFERRPDLLPKSIQDRAAGVKLKIENFYQSSVKLAIERNQRRIELENELNSFNYSNERNSRKLISLGKKESQFLRLRRTRLSLNDFKTIKVIGKGAFGEVRLVQKTDTGKIYAMKTLLKSEMYKKDQLAHVKAERDVLAGSDSPWVVSLYYSFQDNQYLYLIMEFLPGGDLMTMLIRWQIFTEDVTRFYMAECILAIEAIHKLGFIHRDIKPDNILIDIRGHIKLSDFGLSTGFHKTHDSNYYKKLLQKDEEVKGNPNQLSNPTQNQNNNNRQSMVVDSINLTMSNRQQIQTWRKSRRLMAYSTVGTPDYIAPEIFLYQGYGQECDWWSLGAIMYECLIGWPPFCSETPQETYRKIMNFEQTLQFPDDIHISYEAEDLIRRLLTHSDQRLGRHGGPDEIKSHPFFRGVDWNSIRQVEAPYIPKLSSITDTRFFPTDELENVPDSPAMAQAAKQREQMLKQGNNSNNGNRATKEDLPFIGYTYSRFDYLTRKNAI